MALVKHTNNSLTNLTALPSALPTGKMTLLSTATASNSASLSFNSTYINSDYLIYKFEFINIHPANSGGRQLQFNLSIDNGSNFNVVKTTTSFYAWHTESNSVAAVAYATGSDLAQSTAYQLLIAGNVGDDADQALSGSMTLLNPSSAVFVKHFISRINTHSATPYSMDNYIAGYGNTTSAVNAINFKFDEGNIGSGVIKLYGLAN
tara:strand:+ start:136 stop:753 length:618 start_codon:yes stop_codon:yes gene_type:complete